jgi:DNA-directed RNA polymerase I, II, and III subunit RPABC1
MSNQVDFQEKNEWFNVMKTVLEMLQDRGVSIPEHISIINFEQFLIKYDNNNIDIFINDIRLNKNIYVHFNINNIKKFGKNDLVDTLKKVVGTYKDENINLILILKDKENSTVTKELEKKQYENVEIFLKKNMLFNITHHELVPLHIILSEEESNEIIEKYSTPKIKFPKILKSDPVARYYSMKSGMMCKIIRKSPEVGESISYRYCV